MNKANPQQKRKIYSFAAFRLDATERCLWQADELIALKPKQFDLLLHFIENAGRVVRRAELLDAVWTDTYVEENTLTRNVSWLRKLLGNAANGEKIIETVPKIGYRFAAQVTCSLQSHTEENAVIVEEHIIRQPGGEEIIIDKTDAIIGSPIKTAIEERKIINLLQRNAEPPARSLSASTFLLIGITMIGLFVGGFNLYGKYSKAENPQDKIISVKETDIETEAQPENISGLFADEKYQFAAQITESEKHRLMIGSVIHLRNKASNEAGYLDVWGRVGDKPEFSIVPTETMFVSTHPNADRDNGSGSWEIISADGKKVGETLVYGDKVHLKNLHPDAGYLDNCGWLKHMPVYRDFTKAGKFAVFTTFSEDRDEGTGTWIVSSDNKFEGDPVLQEDEIALENGFGGGFLNTAGSVSDIPAFDDYNGARLVFINRASTSRRPDSGTWIISGSQAFSR